MSYYYLLATVFPAPRTISGSLVQGSPTSWPQTGYLSGPGHTVGGELECNALQSSRNHPPPPGLWTNCLPLNESLMPKRLGTIALVDTQHSS